MSKSAISSKKILELLKLFNKGNEVFGDESNFKNWLQEESIALGRQKPIDILQTSKGIQIIWEELTRIEHGIFS